MADFAVTNVTWGSKDFTTTSAAVGTAIVASETAVITPTGPLEEMVIEISNTYAGAIVPVVKAGANPPASSAGLGDLTLTTLANTSGRGILPPLESARFLQANGTLRIDFPANAAGYIIAMQKPVAKSGMA
jgi:hypothetical protein